MARQILRWCIAPVLVLLTACAQIPSQSDVKAGPDLDPQSASEPIYYSPSGPYDGQSQAQIVAGFITAGTGPQNDYLTARDYLAKDFRSVWSPNDEVLVLSGGIVTAVSSDNIATVTIKVQSRVDADGVLYNFTEPLTRELKYQLAQEDGEWRIQSGPNLTILNKPVFDVLFSGYSLYFFDQSRKYLVPELRWLPARASTATRLTNALLDGPSTWLSPAVLSPLPSDVGLAIQAVTVQEGTAIINLNSKANSLSLEDLRYFKTQAQATLRQLPAVSDVSIYLDDVPRPLANVAFNEDFSTSLNPVVLANSRLEFLTSNAVQGSQTLIKQTQARDFALNNETREIVMLSASGLQWAKLGQIDRDLTLLDPRFSLMSPTFDRSGKIWSISEVAGGDVLVVSRGLSLKVRADWLEGYSRSAYAISEEGSRIAFVASNRLGTKILISAIVRDEAGVPIELGKPIEFHPAAGKPVNLTWFGEGSLAVAYQLAATDPISVYQAAIGGITKPYGTVSSVKQIFSDPAAKSLYVLTKAGELWENRGYGFNIVSTKISAAHVPR